VTDVCTDATYRGFLRSAPAFERTPIRSGIVSVEYWFPVGDT
jgi:polyphosphate kinase 2 (PPK2 family)